MNSISSQLLSSQPLSSQPLSPQMWSSQMWSEETQTFRYQFTVFTATHNRAHTLHRVYESLLAQTFGDFEWLVVDDGSTDETRLLIANWQAVATFPIRYIYQEPQGKHVAYNRAAIEADGELIVSLDSDDACVPQALERMKTRWEELPMTVRSRYSGLDCHCMDTNGNQLGTNYPIDGMTSNYPEIRYHYGVTGEKWGFQRTVVLRKYPFPTLVGTRMTHVPEAVVWSPMTLQYPVFYVNECLRIYYTDPVPCTPGAEHLTQRKLANVNPVGLLLMSHTVLEVEITHFSAAPLTFIKSAINYTRAKFHVSARVSPDTHSQLRSDVNHWLSKMLCAVTYPIGYLMYRRDLALLGC